MLHMNQLYGLIEKLQRIVPQQNFTNDKTVEILDFGHGGIINGQYVTPGKRANHGDFVFYEGLWTRMIGWLYAWDLYLNHLSYHILTPGHTDIDLHKRPADANKLDATLQKKFYKTYYHSIHGNAFGVDSVVGIEVYTSPGQTKSDPLATIVYHHLEKNLGWLMRPGLGKGKYGTDVGADPDKEARFVVLVESNMPAFLTENGFYTNREECIKMLQIHNMQEIIKSYRQTHQEISIKKLLS